MSEWSDQGWKAEDLDRLSLSFLNLIFDLKNSQGVNATIEIAKYMNQVGVGPDNYPLFLKLIGMKNHWVVDAIVGDDDIEQFFKLVQPNYFILKECFQAISKVPRGGIYEKSLIIFLSIIEMTYQHPVEGYRIYKLSNEDVNHLGKHLDESQDQSFPLNRKILFILDKIASLIDPGNLEESQVVTAVAVNANNIRGKFLDMTKGLNEAIPDELLVSGNFAEEEISPTT